jgi:pimeloyl-ACP methyl ester carboxylesterase
MYLSVQCREEGPFNSLDNVVPVRTFPVLSESKQGDVASIIEDCATWAVAPGAPFENAPVVSDLPTLVLAGQFDPITPPSQGYRAAETLGHATVVEFPGYGHGVLSEGCAMTIMAAFVDNPAAPVDTSCVVAMGPASFTPPG